MRGIVLGKKSGLDSIRIKVAELGLDVPEERYPDLLAAVKRLGTEKRGLVSDEELRALIDCHVRTWDAPTRRGDMSPPRRPARNAR